MKKALLTEIDQMIEKGLEKSGSYRMATVLRARSSSLEVKTQGNQDSVLSVLGNITREVTYSDSKGKVTKAAVPFVSLSSDSKRRSSDDVIQLDLEAQADNTSTYRLLGNANYTALSDGIAVRSDSYLAGWIESMFNTPLNYKAYIAHMLNAMCYRNLSDEKVKVFVCDFSQVNIKLPHADGSGIANIGRNKFGGQDGSGLIAGPDAKTMQFRLASLFGVGFKLAGEGDDPIREFTENVFTKGLLAKSHLSRVEGDALVFDKANPIDENVVILDVGNFKGLIADKVIKGAAKTLLNQGKVIEMKFRSNPTGSSNKLFVEVTKVSSTATTSASYQWSAVMQLPNIDLNDMKEISPEAISNQQLSDLQKKVLNVVKEEVSQDDRISAKVLSGNANRNQVLSYVLAYLPKVTTRKCVMVNACDDAAGYTGLAEGQIIDTRKDEKFVVGRNPMLTPAGLLVLKNEKNSWLEQIYDLSENVYTIFTAEDCKKIQGDDDGDDNGCDPNPILVDLVEEHQRWVRKSIFANGVSIENDKKARVSEEPKTLKQIADLLKIVRGNTNKVSAKAYCDNSIAGVEQAAVGLCSDIAVNIFAQVKWTRWNGKPSPNDPVIARSKILFQKDLFGELLNQQPDNEKWIWIPNGLESLKMLMLYFLVVWMTQTSIDWKKRSYIILCVLYFLDECRYDQGVFKINKSIMQMKGFDYKAFTAIKKADEKIGQINNHFYPRAEGESAEKLMTLSMLSMKY